MMKRTISQNNENFPKRSKTSIALENAIYNTCKELVKDLFAVNYQDAYKFSQMVKSLSGNELLNTIQNKESELFKAFPIEFIQIHLPKYIVLLTIVQPEFKKRLSKQPVGGFETTKPQSASELLAEMMPKKFSSTSSSSSMIDWILGNVGNSSSTELPDFDDAIEQSIQTISHENKRGSDNLKSVLRKMQKNTELYTFAKKMYNEMRSEKVQKTGLFGCINTLQSELQNNLDENQLKTIGRQATDIIKEVMPQDMIENIQTMEKPEELLGQVMNTEFIQNVLKQQQQ